MEVISHDGEVVDLKRILFLCASYDVKKERFHRGIIKAHFLMIDPGRHMVTRSVDKVSWLSHTANRAVFGFLLYRDKIEI
ncbi:MAG: hypothetical protein WCT14_06585 [Treponemataceae bacterium]